MGVYMHCIVCLYMLVFFVLVCTPLILAVCQACFKETTYLLTYF